MRTISFTIKERSADHCCAVLCDKGREQEGTKEENLFANDILKAVEAALSQAAPVLACGEGHSIEEAEHAAHVSLDIQRAGQ